ncbi:MAG: phospholipase D-like domain-containing protein [Planctomycetota bacterium]|jgi:phosphatidylserine/phosphatidylglycerophosphate/cardiolipin synthase-like enzyme
MWTPLSAALLSLLAQDARPTAGVLTLVESTPTETSLGAPDLPQTAMVWEDMVASARRDLVLSHFYASADAAGPLDRVVDAIEAAGARGVRVRFLLSERFRETYPDVPARLAAAPGVDVRFIDFKQVGGGVMHAKYMVVDGERAFLGSPNFDFRAMDQIQELGVRLEDRGLAGGLSRVFELDWAHAGGEAAPSFEGHVPTAGMLHAATQAGALDAATRVTLACSPRDHLPEGVAWDLPLIEGLIDGARERFRVQVLTYDATGYGGGFFDVLESALRRAAARGVRVELLVADWCKREGCVDGLQSLACIDGIEVRFVVIPEASTGFVPFSRVAHPKFCVADERAAWIGTSNWEGSYFTTSRNVGVVLEGASVGARLARWFDATFASEYAEPVVPGRTYRPRRRQ